MYIVCGQYKQNIITDFILCLHALWLSTKVTVTSSYGKAGAKNSCEPALLLRILINLVQLYSKIWHSRNGYGAVLAKLGK